MWKWLLGIVLAIFVTAWVKRRAKQLAAAHNALLAEHLLSSLDLSVTSDFSQQLAEGLCSMWRSSGFPTMTAEHVARRFNELDRFKQLNMIALACDHIMIETPFPRESWQPLRNPFLVKNDRGSVLALAARLQHDYGVKIEIPTARLKFTEGAVVNS